MSYNSKHLGQDIDKAVELVLQNSDKWGSESSAQIDTTLTKAGQAADAKVVGDKFSKLSEEMLTDAELSNAVDNALAQAKESGEFNGAKGDAGVGIQSVEQTTTSTEDGGVNVVTVTKTDGTSTTFEVRNGSKGTTPQKGTDYWTAADQQAIVDQVLAALPDGDEVSY